LTTPKYDPRFLFFNAQQYLKILIKYRDIHLANSGPGQILRDIGVRTMQLMTNNPAKFSGLKGYGLAVVGRVPVMTPITEENRRYLETKRIKMGHVYGSDIQGPLAGFFDQNLTGLDQQGTEGEEEEERN